MTTTLPYGSWPSPISADLLARGGRPLGGARWVGEQVWWTEGVAAEGGRQAIMRTDGPVQRDGDALTVPEDVVTVLPMPFNARSRVHEYGGGAWTVLEDAPTPATDTPTTPLVLFVNFADQRVYSLREGEEPVALSPVGPEIESAHGPSLRWACPTVVTIPGAPTEVWWVCEDHTDGGTDESGAPVIRRYIAAVPLDGSAAEDRSAIRQVTPASRFVAYPRVSPDGTRMAWISWEHPQMPWDGTELHVARLEGGVCVEEQVIAGSTDISIMQPEWLDAERLLFMSDESGWWNPWTWSSTEGSRQVLEADEEFAGPMWGIGSTWFEVLDADHALVTHGRASVRPGILTVSTGALEDLSCPVTSIGTLSRRADGTMLLSGASPTCFPAILVGTSTADLQELRSSRQDAPDPAVLPQGEDIQVPLPDGGIVHAILYRPRQEGFAAPEGELPPMIARVHGGPTAHTEAVLSLQVAYYTSRGLGVVEINYGGSTGYGRAYRDRLKGQWGVVDVADTVAVMEYLVAEGLADPQRLGIEGGSAGGWTTLACLTRTSTFAAGASSFGVAELEAFRTDTHDFESRYLDQLIGPWPQAQHLYTERAPLSHVDQLSCPVLLLQGDEDRIVPPSQSEMFRDALAAKGIPHAYLLFEGEQHGFRKPENIIAAIQASLSFYGQVFGFEPVDIPRLELQR